MAAGTRGAAVLRRLLCVNRHRQLDHGLHSCDSAVADEDSRVLRPGERETQTIETTREKTDRKSLRRRWFGFRSCSLSSLSSSSSVVYSVAHYRLSLTVGPMAASTMSIKSDPICSRGGGGHTSKRTIRNRERAARRGASVETRGRPLAMSRRTKLALRGGEPARAPPPRGAHNAKL